MANTDLSAKASLYTEGFSAGVQQIRNKLTQLNTALAQNAQEVKKTNSEISSLVKEQQKLASEMKDGGTEEQKKRMQELGDKVAQATAKLGQLKTTQQDLKGALRETSKELADVGKNAGDAGNKMQDAFEGAAAALAAAGITTALKEIYNAFADCVAIAMEFGSNMSTVAALSGADGSEMAELTAQAKELGATTKFTANEAAEAMTYMGMAGWNAQQMMNGMNGVLSLAAASGEDLARVSDIVTDSLTAFGLTAEDTAHFADVLAAAATNSNTTVSGLGETFKYCAPIAGALGYSIEDVATAVGLMANAGIKSSMAGTALRSTFQGLLNGATLTSQAFGEVEVSATRADGTMKSFGETIDELRGYFAQMTDAEKALNANDIAGDRGGTGLLAILNATDEAYDSLKGKIEDCAGAAKDMSEIKMDNLAGDVALMNSAIDAARTTIGESFEPELRELTKTIAAVVSGVNDFATKNEALTKSVIAAGGAFAAFVGAATTISAMQKAMSLLGISINPVALGITALVATFGALTAVITDAVAEEQRFKASLDEIDNRVDEAIIKSNQEADSIRRKVERYDDLRTTAQRTAEEEEELKDIADELQSIFGDNVTVVNSLTGEYKDLTRETEEYIQKLKEETRVYAEKKRIEDLYAKKSEIEEKKAAAAKVRYDIIFDESSGLENDPLKFNKLGKDFSLGQNSQAISVFDDELSMLDERIEYHLNVLEGKQEGFNNKVIDNAEDTNGVLASIVERWNEVNSKSVEETAVIVDKSSEHIQKSFDETKNSISDLAKEAKTLSSAFAEQNKNGSLSTDTILSLVDAGYSAALAVDAETGAVKLDAEAYRELAAAKLEAQKADLEMQKAVVDAKLSAIQTSGSGASEYLELLRQKKELETQAMVLGSIDPGKVIAGGSGGSRSGTSSNEDPELKAFREKRAALKHEYEMGRKEKADYYKELGDLFDEYYRKVNDPNSSDMRSAELELKKYRDGKDEEDYNAEKKALKYRYDMGEISAADYYKRLAALRDKYLKEGTDAWRSATLEIHKYDTQQAEEKAKKAKQRIQDQLKEDTDAVEQRIKDIDKERNEKLAAIDAEIEARKRLREDEDYQRQIDQVNAQLKYGQLDEFSRRQLERKLLNLQDQQAETAWERSMADKRTAVNADADAQKEAAEKEKEELKESADKATTAIDTLSGVMSASADEIAKAVAFLPTVFGSLLFPGASIYKGDTYSSTQQSFNTNVSFGSTPMSIAQFVQAVMDALRSNPIF